MVQDLYSSAIYGDQPVLGSLLTTDVWYIDWSLIVFFSQFRQLLHSNTPWKLPCIFFQLMASLQTPNNILFHKLYENLSSSKLCDLLSSGSFKYLMSIARTAAY